MIRLFRMFDTPARLSTPGHPRPRLALAAALLCCTGVAHAQTSGAADDEDEPATVSRPVVQPTAASAGQALNAALGRLAKDPRNAAALVDAGKAAEALGDADAALGFYSRADQLGTGGASVKAAIGGVRLRQGDPVEALRWFAEAEHAGGDPAAFALDRGLANDLVGDNAAAIAQYRLVLERAGGDAATRDEATRREALSLAIGGDRRGAELALLPLLQRQDRAAWRVHTFILAIAGRADAAVQVAHASMPADLADSIAPYLRFMMRLTPAQQAAAASLGRFPRAADIGRDDPRVLAWAASHPRATLPVPVAAAPVALAAAAPVEDRRARRRHGKDAAIPGAAAPGAAAPVVLAASDPFADLSLPPPPPPPGAAPTAVAPGAPPQVAASRNTVSGGQLAAAGKPGFSTWGVPAATPLSQSQASQSQASQPQAQPPVPAPAQAARPGFDLGRLGGSIATSPAPATPATAPVTAPRASVVIPQPSVLSRLDLPPPTRPAPLPAPVAGSPATPATVAVPVVQPVPSAAPTQVAVAVVQPLPTATPPSAPTASTPAPQPGAIETVPVPPAELPPVAPSAPIPATGAVVQPLPPSPARIDLARAEAARLQAAKEKAARDKAEKEKAEKDKAEKDRAEKEAAAKAKAEKDKKDKAAKEKADKDRAEKDKAEKDAAEKDAKTKGAKDKSGKDADKKVGTRKGEDDDTLAPCKPAKAPRGKTRTTAHGRKAAARDVDTCAADRPDAPGAVSRDSDDDSATKAKGKTGKDAKDSEKAKDSDKTKDKKTGKDTKDTKAKGAAAAHASRIWVQVLTGADRDKMGGEWRGLAAKSRLLKVRKPYLTPWRSNYRLLTGPFASDKEAQDFIADLRKDGVSGFEWTSPAGQAVDSLPLP